MPASEDSTWPKSWADVEVACRHAGKERGKEFGCLMCSRTFGDSCSLYSHIINKPGHASPEEIDRWNREWNA